MANANDSQKLSALERAVQAVSEALTPARASRAAAERSARAELAERQRMAEIAALAIGAILRGDAQALQETLDRFAPEGVWAPIALMDTPPLAYACRAGKSSVEMMEALRRKFPDLFDAPMSVGDMGSLTPLELCLKSGNWQGALMLVRMLPGRPVDDALFQLAVESVARRDGRFVDPQSPSEPDPELFDRWRDARLLLSELLDRQRHPSLNPPGVTGERGPDASVGGLMRLAVPHDALMLYLKERGADVNGADGQGSSAMHKAAESFDARSCQLLAQMGARLNPMDKLGFGPCDLLVKRLADLSCQKNRSEFHALKGRAYQTAETMVALGASPAFFEGHPLFRESDDFCLPVSQAVRRSDGAAKSEPAASGSERAPKPLEASAALSSRRVLSKLKTRPHPSASPKG